MLRDQVIPELLNGMAQDAPLRLCSAGCASGEEAYSLAMLFSEAMGAEPPAYAHLPLIVSIPR